MNKNLYEQFLAGLKPIKESLFGSDIEVITVPTSGTSAGWTYTFDKPVHFKKIKRDVRCTPSATGTGFRGIIPKGSLISSLPGGVFALFPDNAEIPRAYAGLYDERYGMRIIKNPENLEAIVDAF